MNSSAGILALSCRAAAQRGGAGPPPPPIIMLRAFELAQSFPVGMETDERLDSGCYWQQAESIMRTTVSRNARCDGVFIPKWAADLQTGHEENLDPGCGGACRLSRCPGSSAGRGPRGTPVRHDLISKWPEDTCPDAACETLWRFKLGYQIFIVPGEGGWKQACTWQLSDVRLRPQLREVLQNLDASLTSNKSLIYIIQ